MFDTVLVANRGEIACRIIGTLARMGIRSVAVYSDADARARHVGLADIAVRIGPANAAESYLDIDTIVRVALEHGAQAIHPGYGFLAENAAFASACAAAGIVFVGPGVEALEIMGDKLRAKAQVSARGVPVVPGSTGAGLTDVQLAAAAIDIGFPVLVKPSAGGGGKGMHVVGERSELGQALVSARREAAASFGDDTLFIERFVSNPRHIEVQVLADNAGTTVHLGERECSLQRRHQKIIEEAPSPLLDAATRARIGQAACETAASVGYRGAGTVEFIVPADSPDEFFFMEMNTRLQVEHPVTEMVTGFDLVEWQLRIAAGEALGFGQDDIVLTGHAIEARIYAEAPARGFLPTGGQVLALHEPAGPCIRVDSALVEGLSVSSDYDPMLAKVIAWGQDRPSALRRLRAALDDTVVLGVTTNIEFLRLLLDDPDVTAGRLDTGLIERRLGGLEFSAPDAGLFASAALAMHAAEHALAGSGPWDAPNGWRLGEAAASTYPLEVRPGGERAIVMIAGPPESAVVTVGDAAGIPAAIELAGTTATVRLDGVAERVHLAVVDRVMHLSRRGATWTVAETGYERDAATAGAREPELRSPMPGSVVAISAADGELVEAGTPVLVIEAMKMEHVLRATERGTVSLRVEVGAQVAGDEVVAVILPSGEEPAQ